MLALAVVPVLSVAVRKFGRYLRELSHKTQAAAALASSIAEVCLIHQTDIIGKDSLTFINFICVAQESFGAIRTVRSFAQEEFEITRYSEKVDETLNLGLKQAVS